jgi:hypothetical protein
MSIELIFCLAVICGGVIGSVFGSFLGSFNLSVRVGLALAAVGGMVWLFVQCCGGRN